MAMTSSPDSTSSIGYGCSMTYGMPFGAQFIVGSSVRGLKAARVAIALGVNTLIGEKKRVGLFVSPLTDRPTEADCNGHVVAWAYDAYSTVGTTVKSLLGDGGKSFFILSPDYEAGKCHQGTCHCPGWYPNTTPMELVAATMRARAERNALADVPFALTPPIARTRKPDQGALL